MSEPCEGFTARWDMKVNIKVVGAHKDSVTLEVTHGAFGNQSTQTVTMAVGAQTDVVASLSLQIPPWFVRT